MQKSLIYKFTAIGHLFLELFGDTGNSYLYYYMFIYSAAIIESLDIIGKMVVSSQSKNYIASLHPRKF